MSVGSIRTEVGVGQRVPAPVKTKIADKVFSTRGLSDAIFTYMPLIEQDRMKGVSKTSLATAERVQRAEILKQFPKEEMNLTLESGHKVVTEEILKHAPIVNFHKRIWGGGQGYNSWSFSQAHPDTMIGWLRYNETMRLYVLTTEATKVFCLPCLPNEPIHKTKYCHLFNPHQAYFKIEIEPRCQPVRCAYTKLGCHYLGNDCCPPKCCTDSEMPTCCSVLGFWVDCLRSTLEFL